MGANPVGKVSKTPLKPAEKLLFLILHGQWQFNKKDKDLE
jgi:hypothetical protein